MSGHISTDLGGRGVKKKKKTQKLGPEPQTSQPGRQPLRLALENRGKELENKTPTLSCPRSRLTNLTFSNFAVNDIILNSFWRHTVQIHYFPATHTRPLLRRCPRPIPIYPTLITPFTQWGGGGGDSHSLEPQAPQWPGVIHSTDQPVQVSLPRTHTEVL